MHWLAIFVTLAVHSCRVHKTSNPQIVIGVSWPNEDCINAFLFA